VIGLGLNARDSQELAGIEEAIARDDPRFAARLSAFRRVTGDAAMPDQERIRGGGWRSVRGSHSLVNWIVLLTWASVSAALLLVALALSHASSTPRCAPGHGASCARPAAPAAPPGRTRGLRCSSRTERGFSFSRPARTSGSSCISG
jgi:hypothetical protein